MTVLWLARFPLLVIGTAVLHKERVDTIDGKTIYYDMNGTQIEHLTDLYEFNQ